MGLKHGQLNIKPTNLLIPSSIVQKTPQINIDSGVSVSTFTLCLLYFFIMRILICLLHVQYKEGGGLVGRVLDLGSKGI